MNFLTQTMLRDAVISFPMFGDFSINPPSSFTLFGHSFYFYGVIIALGFIFGALYCAKRAPQFGLTEDNLYGLVIWLIPMCIVGARLYYVVFSWDMFAADLSQIFAVWNGGLAIYGGVLAGALTCYIYCRVKKIKLLAALDLLVFGLLIGQILGRWGNFFNREAFGAATDIFCRMGLTSPDGTTIFVHPTFLYESLWNLAGFIALHIWSKKGGRTYDGEAILLYILWYGLGRAWIEGLRTDSLYIGSSDIRVSQLLAIISAVAALVLLIINARKKHDPALMFCNRKDGGDAKDETTDHDTKE